MSLFLNKLSYFLVTIFLSLTLIFFLIRLAPGDPVARILGPNAKMEEIISYREQLGLTKATHVQYIDYLTGIFKGDLGNSLYSKKKITRLMGEHFIPTFTIAFFSILFAFIFGVIFGMLSGIYKSKFFDHLARALAITALSFPIFSLGPVLVYLMAIKLKLLPVSEWGDLKHAILPILTLVIPLGAIITKVTRNKFLEEAKVPWVDFLRAKGMDNNGINLRVLKVCMPTILNIVGIQMSVVLAGTMITETIFDIPGMGMLLFESIQNRDYPVVQGIIVYSTIIYMAIYFTVDYLNEKMDPRIG
ncbi:MAG: hypothetical protein DRQ88_07820 [Epsilonproteobacteria bacterium]|nr:MAG: hypothetical protein DRQ89_07220 [Campylobacterota bacterium]RLA66100.1 MAG: hypothetical protein DRQ88_07820 [Campylobacterota bacterium]